MQDNKSGSYPTSAGILLGLGLGAFFDGIAFHQLLQWHHMLSGWYPLDSIDNIRLNTTWDGHIPQRRLRSPARRALWTVAAGAQPRVALVELALSRHDAAGVGNLQFGRRRDQS